MSSQIADLEAAIEDRFRLVSQNVDGLHIRAGNSLERTYQIHGNIDFMRCTSSACLDRLQPIPDDIATPGRDEKVTDEDLAKASFRRRGRGWCHGRQSRTLLDSFEAWGSSRTRGVRV